MRIKLLGKSTHTIPRKKKHALEREGFIHKKINKGGGTRDGVWHVRVI